MTTFFNVDEYNTRLHTSYISLKGIVCTVDLCCVRQ